jgi:hypothetical protein
LKLGEDLKTANHHEQVLEKQMLKLQEDLEFSTSKYETLRDSEMVSFSLKINPDKIEYS